MFLAQSIMSALKERNIMFKYHALIALVFSIVYCFVSNYDISEYEDDNYTYSNFKNCLMLSINTQTGLGYSFTELPKSNLLVFLVHIQLILSFLLLNI